MIQNPTTKAEKKFNETITFWKAEGADIKLKETEDEFLGKTIEASFFVGERVLGKESVQMTWSLQYPSKKHFKGRRIALSFFGLVRLVP